MMTNEQKAEIRTLRAQGMTGKKIASFYGVTPSYIYEICKGVTRKHFQYIDEDGCIWPGLRRWMNENHISKSELLRRMGRSPAESGKSWMTGRYQPTKPCIDAVLRVTGMTYEEAFGERKDDAVT